MPKTDYVGFEQATAISVNYALDSVEGEILKELGSGADISRDTLHRLLNVIRTQRIGRCLSLVETLQ